MTAKDRAREAEAILSNPLIVEFFEYAEQDAFNRFRDSTPDQWQEREELHARLEAVREFHDYLRTVVTNGSVSDAKAAGSPGSRFISMFR